MIQNLLKQNNQLILIFLWISLWFSIGTYPTIESFSIYETNYQDLIYRTRLYGPTILFFVVSFLFLFKKINLIFRNKKLLIFFLLFFFFQLVGAFFNKEKNFDFNNTFLIFYGIISVLLISCLSEKNLRIIQIINLCFMILAFIVFIFPVYESFIDMKNHKFYMYNYTDWNKSSFGTPNARVTGIARYCLIITVFIYSYILFFRLNKIQFIFSFLALIFFILNIWLLQTRLVIGSFLIIFFVSLFFKTPLYSKYKIVVYFFIIITSVIFLTNQIQNYKKKLIMNEIKEKMLENVSIDLENVSKDLENVSKDLENVSKDLENLSEDKDSINNFIIEKEIEFEKDIYNTRVKSIDSSGRLEIWKSLINKYDKSKIFGYGSQADRFLLNDPDRSLSTNASNGMIYSLISGGYFCFLTFVIILLFVLFTNLNYLMINFKGAKIILFDINAFLIINFLLIRQLFENSFAVYSVDLLLFLSFYSYLERRLEK